MKPNQDDWIDAVRAALRDAEAKPSAGGWERLERALAEAEAPQGAVAGRRRLVPGGPLRRWMSMAAALLLTLAGGGYLWRAGDRLPDALPAAGSMVAELPGGALAADAPAGEDDGTEAAAGQMAERIAGALVPQRRAADLAGAEFAAGRSHAAREQAPALLAAKRAPEHAGTVAAGHEGALRVGHEETLLSGREEPLREPDAGADANPSREAAPAVATDAPDSFDTPDAPARPAVRGDRSGRNDRSDRSRSAAPRSSVRAERRTSFAFHAAGMPGSGGGGALREVFADAPSAGPIVSSTLVHAPGDVVTHVVRDLSLPLEAHDYRHRQPVSAGVAFRRGFAYGLSLETGVNYTLLRSDVTVAGRGTAIDQRLHFVGVPLRLNWQFFERGPLSLYIGAGGQVEKCVAARFGGRKVDEPGVQWSLAAVAGAQCRLGGAVGLYFEPEAAWYLDETTLRTSRTDRPTTFTLRLGVRFSF